MRLHEFTVGKDTLMFREESGNFVVLTPDGAVFNNFITHDLTHMSVAYAALFKDGWAQATDEQLKEWVKMPDEMLVKLIWAEMPTKSMRPVEKVWDGSLTTADRANDAPTIKKVNPFKLIKGGSTEPIDEV